MLSHTYIDALSKATFVAINGHMYRVDSFFNDGDGYCLYFSDENTGDEFINNEEQLAADEDEIEIYSLKQIWGE